MPCVSGRAALRCSLSSNFIGPDGAKAIAASLPLCKTLVYLRYGPDPCVETTTRHSHGLTRPTPLWRSLYHNNIGDDGARAIAAALPASKLTHLLCVRVRAAASLWPLPH